MESEGPKTTIIDPEAGVQDPAISQASTSPPLDDAASKHFTCVYFGYGSNLSPGP